MENMNSTDIKEEGLTQETLNDTETTEENTNETVTMSKDDFNKAIQAAEDRLRTKYSKEIKSLEAKVVELTPVEKTEAEIAFEQRLADLERKEKETEDKERMVNLRSSLQSCDIDADFANYLNNDVDVKGFSEAIEKLVTMRLTKGGYKPTGHQTNQPVSRAEYDKMSYDEKVELYRRDNDSWKRLKK